MSGNINNSDSKILAKFLSPSSTSITVTCFLLVVVGFVVFAFARYKSLVPQSLQSIDFLYHSSRLIPTTHDIGNEIANNSYLRNSPLFIFWCFVGLICYSIVEAIIKGAKDAGEIAGEFKFVNIQKQGVLVYVLIRTAIRIISLFGIIVLFRYTLFAVIPHFISSIQIWAINLLNFSHLFSALAYILLLALCMHGLVVLVRFIFLRPRLFGNGLIF